MTMKQDTDSFWAENPAILWQRNRLSEFIPAPNMSWAEMLNAVVRGAALVSILLALYFRTDAPLYILLFTLIITYIIAKYPGPVMMQLNKAQSWLKKLPTQEQYASQENGTKKTTMTKEETKESEKEQMVEQFVQPLYKEQDWKKAPIQPTADNPFMNFNIFTDPMNKPAAPLSYGSPSLQAEIEKQYQKDLYRDVGDLYNKSNGQREFYTTPSTTFPNDQTSFARWCYSSPPTCKEEGIRCVPYDTNPVNPISTSAQAMYYPTPTVPTVQTPIS